MQRQQEELKELEFKAATPRIEFEAITTLKTTLIMQRQQEELNELKFKATTLRIYLMV